ncbi:MAG: hypothetical protein J5724_04245 [Ruminococcus sp.]|nr:hypothetical protein [Ruminococcus sp.]
MKKTLIAFAVAAMAFAAVSCGEKKTDSSPESGSPATTAEESADELMKDMLKKSYSDNADMTAQQTEKYDIPDGWKEIEVESLKIYVPSAVEELSADPGTRRFGDKAEGLYLITSPAKEYDGGLALSALDPDTSEEKVSLAFSELGIEYNGTRLSFFKAALSLTDSDKTSENAEAYETALSAKENEFALDKEIYVTGSEGHPIYIEVRKDFGLKNRKPSVCADFFIDEKTVQSVTVNAETLEEALRIAANLRLAQEQG